MERTLLAALGLAILSLSALTQPPTARAQNTDPPFVMHVRSWKCDAEQLDAAIELLQGMPREVAEELIGEGRLTSWGVARQYGEEWNLHADFLARDRETAVAAQREWSRRVNGRDPDEDLKQRFAAMCPNRDDNVYSVRDCPPPEEEEEGQSGQNAGS